MFLKSISSAGAIALCCLFYCRSSAQVSLPYRQSDRVKAEIFKALPDTIGALTSIFENIFRLPLAQAVKIPAGADHYFEGILIEKVEKSPGVTSINIKSSNFEGALITLSRIALKNRAVEYVGRIVNIKYGDMYILAKQNDRYYFTKQKQSRFLVE